VRSVTAAAVAVLSFVSQLGAAPLVVETDPLTPDQQRAAFRLPPGFEIQLVAAEPDIGQPMQINFDAAGRLWVTHSLEYPYPARGEGVEPRDERFPQVGDHDPRDRLTVFEGIGPDGRPAKITHFAQGLNIPIGQVPAPHGSVYFSIPNIWLGRDEDRDGLEDSRTAIYGRIGNVDTHGMASSFTRWIDGWIYATHGFRNTSRIEAHPLNGEPADPSAVITLNSGNTFRFREDGSRIEQWTWGQVNPFGLTFDPWGNLYSADCHSMPLTGLVRGACYSSFGKPHDGLGFGPDMIDHIHESTGICGAAWYDAAQFPEEYRGCIYLCNPVNGFVHRDRITFRGSSPWVQTQPDFITCDDGWFRPVDVKLGPDGALYVADFYNCIIGHYEVPLDHPRRDREKGRIWRVVYMGDAAAQTVTPPDLTALDMTELIEQLKSPNFTVRTLATNHLFDRYGLEVSEPLQVLLVEESTPEQRLAAAWLLWRTGALSEPLVAVLSTDSSALVRTHLAHILAEMPEWSASVGTIARSLLADADPFVVRAAADGAGRHPSVENVDPLLNAFLAADPADAALRHTVKIALRDQLLQSGIAGSEAVARAASEHSELLADAALGAPTPEAAAIVVARLEQAPRQGRHAEYLQFAARYADGRLLRRLIEPLRAASESDPQAALSDLEALAAGLEAGGIPPRDVLGDWPAQLAQRLLREGLQTPGGWTPLPVPGRASDGDVFVVQMRPSADGDAGSAFFCSLPNGEQKTGLYRSAEFEIPERLTFFMAGHNGLPTTPVEPRNAVRLRDAESGDVLAEALPPRNDMARQFAWDLKSYAGRRGVIEITDSDSRDAYAWLAVGRFSIPALNPTAFSPLAAATRLIARLHIAELRADLAAATVDADISTPARVRCSDSLLSLEGDARLSALLPGVAAGDWPATLCEQILLLTAARDEAGIETALSEAMLRATAVQQRQMAEALTGDRRGAETLIRLIESGRCSARLLTDAGLQQRLTAALGPQAQDRIDELTSGLPTASEATDELIARRRAEFTAEGTSTERGRALIKQHCAACHQLGTEGKKVGPRLDGIGLRGTDRLLEDILDPSRNVDAAFRTTTIVTRDGVIVSGLPLREEGAVLVLANNKGEEVPVPMADIDQQVLSSTSLMPANFGELLPPQDLNELIAELLRQQEPVP
jgi:putative heme-binding domain-containing protein